MADNVDAEVLISLIEARPVLWDKTLDVFKDRIATRNAWREVCQELQPEFEKLEDREKDAFDKDVLKRWTNLRDAFAKSNKKNKDSKTSGSGAKRSKKYVFNDQLQFLKKLYDDRVTVDSFGDDAGEESVEDTEHNTEGATESTTVEAINQTTKQASSRARKHRKPDEVELRIIKALEAEKPNSNLSFFHSLLPHLDKYDESDMLEFQMGVLQVISNINQKKKMVLYQPSPQLWPQPPATISQPHSFTSNSAAQYYQNASRSPGHTLHEGYARNTSTPFSSECSTVDSVDFTS